MIYSGLSEKEILECAKKGDMEAFERFLLIYEKPVYGYILRLVGRKEDAEDLTQETFIKIYRSLAAINPEKKFKAWVYKVATNTVYNWFKYKKIRPEIFIVDDEKNDFETIDPKSLYYNIEASYDVEKALAKIKPLYKTVLLLFYWQGMDYKEIAEIMLLPINTVKTYLRRAKIALAEEINQNKQK